MMQNPEIKFILVKHVILLKNRIFMQLVKKFLPAIETSLIILITRVSQ
jgi:hypothetical protein